MVSKEVHLPLFLLLQPPLETIPIPRIVILISYSNRRIIKTHQQRGCGSKLLGGSIFVEH